MRNICCKQKKRYTKQAKPLVFILQRYVNVIFGANIITLCVKLRNEVNDYNIIIKHFQVGTSILEGVNKYITGKQYNTDCADIILLALSYALGITATVYQYRVDSVTEINKCTEGLV